MISAFYIECKIVNAGVNRMWQFTLKSSFPLHTIVFKRYLGLVVETVGNTQPTLGQFHQHFTCSFCARRSQKRKKILMLLGATRITAVRKFVGKIDPLMFFKERLKKSFKKLLP
jgi:hypothetical protein